MSESKARLEREVLELRKKAAAFDVLLRAALAAEHELVSRTADDPVEAALQPLETALNQMRPPRPEPPPIPATVKTPDGEPRAAMYYPRHGSSRIFLSVAAAALASTLPLTPTHDVVAGGPERPKGRSR